MNEPENFARAYVLWPSNYVIPQSGTRRICWSHVCFREQLVWKVWVSSWQILLEKTKHHLENKLLLISINSKPLKQATVAERKCSFLGVPIRNQFLKISFNNSGGFGPELAPSFYQEFPFGGC